MSELKFTISKPNNKASEPASAKAQAYTELLQETMKVRKESLPFQKLRFSVRHFSLFILIAVFTWSCSGKEREEFKEIDTLAASLKESKKKLNDVNDLEYKSIISTVDSNVSVFKKTFHDTLDFETGIMFQQYVNAKKQIGRFYEIKTQLLNNIDYSLTQLEALKKDYSSEKIDDAKFEEYFKTEIQEGNKLVTLTNDRLKILYRMKQDFDSLHPKVTEYNTNLLAKKK